MKNPPFSSLVWDSLTSPPPLTNWMQCIGGELEQALAGVSKHWTGIWNGTVIVHSDISIASAVQSTWEHIGSVSATSIIYVENMAVRLLRNKHVFLRRNYYYSTNTKSYLRYDVWMHTDTACIQHINVSFLRCTPKEITRKGTCGQWRRKTNLKSNMTERAELEQQKQQHRLSKPRTTERPRRACYLCS